MRVYKIELKPESTDNTALIVGHTYIGFFMGTVTSKRIQQHMKDVLSLIDRKIEL